jgi:hypothetical protein
MGKRPRFDDLRQVHPDIYANLKKLAEYPGEVSELGLVFQVVSTLTSSSWHLSMHLSMRLARVLTCSIAGRASLFPSWDPCTNGSSPFFEGSESSPFCGSPQGYFGLWCGAEPRRSALVPVAATNGLRLAPLVMQNRACGTRLGPSTPSVQDALLLSSDAFLTLQATQGMRRRVQPLRHNVASRQRGSRGGGWG